MKVITGKWQDPSGANISFGILSLKLSQDAVVLLTSQIAPRIIQITLDTNGAIPSNTQIWANDELSPNGTFYTLTVMEQGGGVIYGPENFSIAGSSPINLNNIVPVGGGGGGGGGGSISVSVQDSVQFISTNQTLSFLGAPNSLVEATGGVAGITLTLPSAVGVSGQTFRIVRVDAAVGVVSIVTTASQTISGRANWSLTNQWEYAQIESDNANWVVTAFN